MTVAETITDKLKLSLLKQSELVDVLIEDHPWKTRLIAVSELMATMKEMASSIPQIESAVVYATKAHARSNHRAWRDGSAEMKLHTPL